VRRKPDTRRELRLIEDLSTRRWLEALAHPDQEKPMDHLQGFVHMDEQWMWRWYITDFHGHMFASSRTDFFWREDALRNLKAVRLTLSG
jgi:hypothetical protein